MERRDPLAVDRHIAGFCSDPAEPYQQQGGLDMASATDRDPRHHTQKMQKALHDIRDHLRQDIQKVDEPQLKAMFETSAEVLGGLEKAFKDYEQKNEKAWR
ncbi:hypothetical protein [Bradyrhizobium acaciae]|uniref:hypothetical protein n=1 Tax=Bradyrhizobium acaciae TaxID=2683706 RepID=UPI001E2B6275|nr:hypothetical protein [Bradyrhizobium acaciae]